MPKNSDSGEFFVGDLNHPATMSHTKTEALAGCPQRLHTAYPCNSSLRPNLTVFTMFHTKARINLERPFDDLE